LQDLDRDHQVPIPRPPAVYAFASHKIVGLAGAQPSQRFQVGIINHQCFTMLFQKEPNLGGRSRIFQYKDVGDDLIQVEELNRF
jgi:hypothetical protein